MCSVLDYALVFDKREERAVKVSGKLFIIATPIGNLSDISTRMESSLKECDLLFVEDTRVSIKLLNHLSLSIPMLSCHKHNERERLQALEKVAAEGRNAGLMSDAGIPLISDPGDPLVRRAIELGMTVIPVAGPCAFVMALVGSGFDLSSFVFEGFLPDGNAPLRQKLNQLKGERRTLAFYVSPHKLKHTLEMMREVIGNRRACLARELTKFYEEFLRGDLSRLIEICDERELKGEMVLVLEGDLAVEKDMSEWLNTPSLHDEVMEHVRGGLSQGLKLSKACQLTAQYFSIVKADIYKEAVRLFRDQV